ncbi:GDP-perosamine synthase [Paraliobacillus ryukyuensis]|uniref:Perosamine synthetase n=1 Tax=Paraliobacillus ryukyuensis TaxID=200904 RepID=A0A366EFD7_9BACI|nr:LegC family aminotransferase [Paraliobacillus ryukyuensis]RBP00736.1 perosamine synthetase [Paraliobacillus ryukyuensis]
MNKQLIDQITNAIKSVMPTDQEVYPLHTPKFQGNEWKYMKDCIDSTWVSSVGKYVDQFEKELAAYTGVKRAIAVTNGTAALHLSLIVTGVQPGDEVLIPSLSFVATANAVTYCQATPHFVDCDQKTLGINVKKLFAYLETNTFVKQGQLYNKHTNNRISTIVPMHTFGHPVDMDELLELAKQFDLKVVEDAAEGLGSFYKGKHVGSFGDTAALSFNGNKVITTGGGGAVLTNDETLADRAKHLSTVAKVPHQWEYIHDEIGFNYRMPNINAALGCAQLEQIPLFLEKKRNLAYQYNKVIKSIEGIEFFTEKEHNHSNYWLNAILLDDPDINLRNEIIQRLHKEKILVRPIWKPLNELVMYQNCPRMDLSVSKDLNERIINLPSNVWE